MKHTLELIASIQTGIFATTFQGGDVVYLQAKHFDEYGKLNSSLYPELKLDSITNKHLLKHGDVLFSAKGTKNFATWYEMGNQPAVASTSFFVIRVNENYRNKILPEYLVWFLNQPIAQKYLKSNAIGTALPSISKMVLQSLEINIPDLETQKAILKIYKLRSTERKLIMKIEKLREQQIQNLLINSTQK